MLAHFRGEPMIHAVLRNVTSASVDKVIVVTGHESGKLSSVLADTDVHLVHNPAYESGLASSIRVGVEAADQSDAVLVCLGDMPLVKPQTINRLIAAFNPAEHRAVIVPTYKGELGNPVLWGREHYARLMGLSGDRGARSLLQDLSAERVEVVVDDSGILMDADTPETLARLNEA